MNLFSYIQGAPQLVLACLAHGVFSMFIGIWRAALLALLTVLVLAGCSGNYKFDDDRYRPVGDPQALKRGN